MTDTTRHHGARCTTCNGDNLEPETGGCLDCASATNDDRYQRFKAARDDVQTALTLATSLDPNASLTLRAQHAAMILDRQAAIERREDTARVWRELHGTREALEWLDVHLNGDKLKGER